MIIKQAEFVISNTNIDKCPKPNMPEYAFIGRSNVGKSSLINMLTGRKKLAKISVKPGKTQLINHFIINEDWYLVDLPGYGYAKVSKTSKEKWQKFIYKYIENRENLVCLFVLIDSRLEPQKIDLDFIENLGQKHIPFALVYTKADKLTKIKLEKNIETFRKKMLETWEELPNEFITSSEKVIGRDDVLSYIDELNKLYYIKK
ncbi:MAG: YihA family ribosome biogenesis GTP-binding protein [Bacteroidetes bacterium]|nr:MAG: YihA family ribosome biogenesis GTP-binding protein [Bacteroidota bacterium]